MMLQGGRVFTDALWPPQETRASSAETTLWWKLRSLPGRADGWSWKPSRREWKSARHLGLYDRTEQLETVLLRFCRGQTTHRTTSSGSLDIFNTQVWSITSLSLPLIKSNFIWVYRIRSALPAAFGNLIFKSLAHGAFTQIASALFLCQTLSR